MGKLTFVHGVMDAGKTHALLARAHGMEAKGYNILTVKSDADLETKGDMIQSRSRLKRRADIILSDEMSLIEEVNRRRGGKLINHILGEEAMFWTPQQAEESFELAVEHGIDVTVYGLRSDFQTKAFPASQRFFELAHSLSELDAPCRCMQEDAKFNARKYKGEFVFEGDQKAVDNHKDVTYESLCPTCYLKEKRAAIGRAAHDIYQTQQALTAQPQSQGAPV